MVFKNEPSTGDRPFIWLWVDFGLTISLHIRPLFVNIYLYHVSYIQVKKESMLVGNVRWSGIKKHTGKEF